MKPVVLLLLMTAYGAAFGGCALTHPTDPYAPDGKRAVPAVQPSPQKASPDTPAPTDNGEPALPHHDVSLTLDEAVETALAKNPDIAAARWESAAAEARQKQAYGERLPHIGLAGDYTRTLDEERVIGTRFEGEPGAFSRSIASGQLVLSVPLFAGGRMVNEQRAAERLWDASGHRAARTRRELVYDVTRVFYYILARRGIINSLSYSQDALEAQLKQTDALIEAQKAAPVDRMRTEVRLADIRQSLAGEKARLAVEERTLAGLLGLSRTASGRVSPDGELAREIPYEAPAFSDALDAAWANRSDYLAAKADLEAKARRVDAARAGRWPLVSMTGAYGGRTAVGSTRGPGDDRGEVGHIGIEMEMPLFEGGRIDAGIREKQADLSAARARLRGLEDRVRIEIETALSDVKTAEAQLNAVSASIRQARESLRIEKEKYAAGRGSIGDVLDAQTALLASEKTQYRVMADLRIAVARLELAMGE